MSEFHVILSKLDFVRGEISIEKAEKRRILVDERTSGRKALYLRRERILSRLGVM